MNKKEKIIFFGGAIQGSLNKEETTAISKQFLETIKESGFQLFTEHTKELNFFKSRESLEKKFGSLPTDELEYRNLVRNKLIEGIEGNICGAIFEVSTPSLGTGIEIAHAYLRPKLGLPPIPILALYRKDSWSNKLSTMIRGISKEIYPNFTVYDYTSIENGKLAIKEFLKNCNNL